MKPKDKNMIIMVGLAVIIIFSIGKSGLMNNINLSDINTIPGNWDISSQVQAKGYELYLIEEVDFDYSDPGIQALAKQIKEMTSTPDEAVKQTIKYVVQNVRYSSAVTVNGCYAETASSVLEDKVGDCVSMSRLVTALLRAQGIPARTSGGCLSFNGRCSPLFAVIPELEIQVTPMEEGDFKKRGFLHEWVEVWTPTKGWFLVEATAGQTYRLECSQYIQYSYDSNQYNRCVINDQNFWEMCRQA